VAGAYSVLAMGGVLNMPPQYGRASLVPAAAVIPAPVEYAGVAAVEEPVAWSPARGETVLLKEAVSTISGI
jgi:hypothetical protein